MKKTLASATVLALAVVSVLLLQGGGQASDPLGVAVADAATACPGGFTVAVQGLPAGSPPTGSLSPAAPDSCVLTLGIPAGAAGAAGAAGTNGVSGYVVKTADVISSDPQSVAATATCPAGTKAIGGGGSVTATKGKNMAARDGFAVTASGPTPDGGGWTVQSHNLNFSKSNVNGSRLNSHNLNLSKSNVNVTAICAAVAAS